jgi:rhodanese-related sulfurtransferase
VLPFRGFHAGDRPGGGRLKNILLEGLIVAACGALLAFVANAISPRGLSLGRDYFPNARAAGTTATTTNSSSAVSNTLSAVDKLSARLREENLHLAGSNQVTQLFQDPRYAQGRLIFVDARNDEHYQAGHIPGAYQLDHYRPTDYLAAVLPACQIAEQIVVYCNGGDCEDSENTAIFLRDAQIPPEKLFVYAGGIAEWSANGMPIETGERNSGNMRKGK